jgi:hypothetical protein
MGYATMSYDTMGYATMGYATMGYATMTGKYEVVRMWQEGVSTSFKIQY